MLLSLPSGSAIDMRSIANTFLNTLTHRNMSDIILADSTPNSPFDSIQRFDDKGEFWLARELMTLLGYLKWERFDSTVSQAIENLQLNGDNVLDNIFPLAGSTVTKSTGKDYKLSRYGCYMTALCADGRKIEVAQAKKYFAIKAREAEIIIPVQNDRIRELELMVRLAEAEADRSRAEQRLLDTRDTILKLQPQAIADRIFGVTTIEKVEIRTKIVDENDRILNAANTVSKTDLAYRYGFVTKTGKADTKLVSNLINEAISYGVIENPWHDIRVVASSGFDADLVPVLDRYVQASPVDRQRWIGE
jgi:hypothetical protein